MSFPRDRENYRNKHELRQECETGARTTKYFVLNLKEKDNEQRIEKMKLYKCYSFLLIVKDKRTYLNISKLYAYL